tara:strand:+ start:1023 stop:1310 length:288 start_codon:yes stop_codon:yes gene_type:complete
MINKKGLIGLVTAVTVLNGCNNSESDSKSSKIPSGQIGNYIIETQAHNAFADYFLENHEDFREKDLINFAKEADNNNDFYLSEQEAKDYINFTKN